MTGSITADLQSAYMFCKLISVRSTDVRRQEMMNKYPGAYSRRTQSKPTSRWMNLRYAGACKVCGTTVPEGELAYWDAATKQVTCHGIDCCQRDGLTSSQWSGSPVSGRMIQARTERRVGSPYSGN